MPHSRTFKAAMLGSGKFLVTLTALVSAAVLSRILTKTEYAAYKQTLLACGFVTPFLTLGLPQALYYFLPREKENRRSVLSGNLLMLFAMGSLFGIAMWSGGNELLANRFNNPMLSKLLLIYSPYGLLALPVMAISSCLVSQDKVKILTIYNITSKIVIFVCIIGLVLIWRSADAAISGATAAAFLVFFPAILLMYRATNGQNWQPNMLNMWEQIKYSVPLGVAYILGSMQVNIDKMIVSSMCSPEEFAIYVNGAVEIPLVGMITGSVTSVLIPEFASLYKNERFSELLNLWRRAVVKTSYLIFPVMVYLLAMSDEFIRIIFSGKYAMSAVPFRIYLLFLMARITTFSSVEMAAGKNKIVLLAFGSGLIVNIILTITFIPIFGYIGAAIATVVTTYLFAIPFHIFVYNKILKAPIFKLLPFKELSRVMFGSLLCLPLTFSKLLIPESDLLKLVFTSILFFTGIVVVFRISGISDFISEVKSLNFK